MDEISKFSLICTLCNKQFKSNYLYQRHINQKIKCNIIPIKKEKQKYNCESCNILFNSKYLLNKHSNSKVCNKNKKNINKDMIENNNMLTISQIRKKIYNLQFKLLQKYNKSLSNLNFTCDFCNHKYSKKENLTRHINNNCKEKKIIDNDIELLKIELKKYNKLKLEILKEIKLKQVTHCNNKINTQNITNNITNNNNNITNNNLTLQIQIKDFGDEDDSYITLNDYKKCLERRYPGLFEYIKLIHLNINAPQNHNILLTNERSKFIKVYKGGKFKREYKDEIIEEILDNNMWRLERKASELDGKVNPKIINNHKEFKEIYYTNDKEIIKRNKDKVESMLLDDKDIIENTHNNKQLRLK